MSDVLEAAALRRAGDLAGALALYDRILAAFEGRDAQGDLTALFATLLAHLP